MKIAGKQIERYTGKVVIGRDNGKGGIEQITILVRQLPISWPEECEIQLPQPTPPIVGKQYDKQGRESPKYNEDDPAYREKLRQWEHRTWAKKIHDATVDPGITWETTFDGDQGKFYDGIFAELDASFSRQEINYWLLTINAIDQVGGADIALRQEGLRRVLFGDGSVPQLAEEPGDGGAE